MKKEEIENYNELIKDINRSSLYRMLNSFNKYVEMYGEDSDYYYVREKIINELQKRKEEL